MARSGSRNSKPQQRPPMSFRDYIKASGVSPNPQFRVRPSSVSSPMDNLSSAGLSSIQNTRPPVQEAAVRPNRFLSLSREVEPRFMSQDQRIASRGNSGPRISLYNAPAIQKRPEFLTFRNQAVSDQSLHQLGLPQENTLIAGLKSNVQFETYLRFLSKQDANVTILTDVFHGISKSDFTEMLQPMKADESHTFIVFQRVTCNQCHLFVISMKELLHFQFRDTESDDAQNQQGYFLGQPYLTAFTLQDRCDMIEKARQFHAHLFKGRLVIPTTSEFPQTGTQAEMCSLYLMTMLRQKLTGKQLDWN